MAIQGQLPSEKGQCFCQKERKWMRPAMFYTYKDGSMSKMCKKCLTMHIDNYDSNTFTWLLQDFDVPWIPGEWNTLLNKEYAKNPDKAANSGAIFGKYLSKMKLKQWKDYSWADSQMLQQQNEARTVKETEEQKKADEEFLKKLQVDYAEGKISEAEYKTLMPIPAQKEDIENKAKTSKEIDKDVDNPFQEEQFIDEKDLPNPAADLTEDDKIKLAVKWGRLYKPNEWIQLEKDYRQMTNDFEIDDADTENALILICKLNLKVNQCLDRGDYDGFTKLSKELSNQRKLANFTALSRKKDGKQQDFITSAGELVAYCQKNGGVIPKFKTDAPLDIVDKELQDQKNYLKSLIQGDPALSREIEEYIKKREVQEEQDRDQKEAEEKGLEQRELTEEDFAAYSDFIANEKEKDGAIQSGVDTQQARPGGVK